ncbi:hypothetical protein BVY02_00010 [bacterium J17]|nr:hypothetical protein BVY02_00010 [bacterium J17]
MKVEIPKTRATLLAADWRRFHLLQLIRAAIFVGFTFFLSSITELGTSAFFLSAAAVLGTWLAGRTLRSSSSFLKSCRNHLTVFALVAVAIWLWNNIMIAGSAEASNDFFVARIADNLVLVAIFYSAGFLSTWLFWSWRPAATIESVLLAASYIWVLAGHRNYQLDAPKTVSDLAWKYHLEPQHLLLSLGVVFTIFIASYLGLSTNRPILRGSTVIRSTGRPRRAVLGFTSLALIALLISYAYLVNQSYSLDLSRTSNGVGQGGEEGQSPLGFHSAVGKTKQPSALVRLEGDYSKNPWAPMLYLREGALSQYDGKELVLANPLFDTDTPRSSPGQPYIGIENKDVGERQEVVQSIYLLTKHNSAFAIDYPRSIRLIKNPDPERFEIAYQALSFAPTVPLNDLAGYEVGNPNWDKSTLDHYLRAPGSLSEAKAEELPPLDQETLDVRGEDLRYKTMSNKLAQDFDQPTIKAASIVDYLSKNSLYTRSPGHTANSNGDPVAPYLFSEEMRGYCVHFAHAAVYMMRLAGIPSRIATGYLTDLSYAKDGHILLHLGDRHAWPEIYVRGLGWVVVDVTPTQAENEQELIPNEQLLEELMSKIDPAQEILEPLPPEPDENLGQDSIVSQIFEKKFILPALSLLLIIWIAMKGFFRFAYRFVKTPEKKYKFAYMSFASLMSDLGRHRLPGETRREYAKRLATIYGVNAVKITHLLELITYDSKEKPPSVDDMLIDDAQDSYMEELNRDKLGRLKRLAAFFSPLSVSRIGKW